MKIGTSYIVGFDITGSDESTAVVTQYHGARGEIVNIIQGKEAEELYEKISKKKLKKEKYEKIGRFEVIYRSEPGVDNGITIIRDTETGFEYKKEDLK